MTTDILDRTIVEASALKARTLAAAASRPWRLAMVYSHPIHYFAPLLRKVAVQPDIDLTVFFCSTAGVTREYCPELGSYFQYDTPLLDGYRSIVVPNRSPKPSIFSFWGLFNPGLALELGRGRFDAILVHGWGHLSMLLAIARARLAHIPLLMYGDSADPHPLPPHWPGKALAKRLFMRALLPCVDAYLISGTLNEAFYRHYGSPPDRMFLTPWSVDNDFFIDASRQWRPRRDDLLRERGLDPSSTVFLSVGKITSRKRPLDLIQAAERVTQRGHKVAVLIAGEGAERPALERYIQARHIDWVRFLGFVNQSAMPRVYGAADALVQPSECDPRITVVNEAMASGLPIIVSDGTGVWGEGDIVRHGDNGFVFPKRHIDELASHLQLLAADPNLRARMGARSREIIATWSHGAFIQGLRSALQFVAPHHVDLSTRAIA